MLLGAFIGLKYSAFGNFKDIFNFAISLLIVLFYSGITILINMKIFLYNKGSKDIVQETHKKTIWRHWEFLYSKVNKNVSNSSYIIAFTVIKDFGFSPFIIFGINDANI